MERRQFLACGSAAAVALLTGCATSPDDFGSGDATVSFETLVRQLKYDIGTYLWRHKDEKEALNRPGPDATDQEKAEFQQMLSGGQYRAQQDGEACVGQVTFTLTRVKLTVATTVEQKASGSAGLEVPIGVVTVAPAGSISRLRSSSLTTTLDIYPTYNEDFEVMDSAPAATPEFVGHPITDTLEALRSDLIKTADTKPCFNFGVEETQKGNSVKLGFAVTRTAGTGGKLKILIFSLGAETSVSRNVANTIEVFFVSKGEFG